MAGQLVLKKCGKIQNVVSSSDFEMFSPEIHAVMYCLCLDGGTYSYSAIPYKTCAENEVLNALSVCVPKVQIQQPEEPVDLSALFGYNEQ